MNFICPNRARRGSLLSEGKSIVFHTLKVNCFRACQLAFQLNGARLSFTRDAERGAEFVIAGIPLADTSRTIVYAIGDAESSQSLTETAHKGGEVCVRGKRHKKYLRWSDYRRER
jgi:hypothetical protein